MESIRSTIAMSMPLEKDETSRLAPLISSRIYQEKKGHKPEK